MPQPRLPAADPGLPLTRRKIEQHVDASIDLLDTLDPDPDLEPDLAGYSTGMDSREGDDPDLEPDSDDEPSLGWQGPSGWLGESTDQSMPDFYANADAGCGLEDEHGGGEPDVDDEFSLGWTAAANQDTAVQDSVRSDDREFDEAELEPDLGWHNETGRNYVGSPILDAEATSPEWPAEHPQWQPPTRRRVAPPVPVIPMSMCGRVSR